MVELYSGDFNNVGEMAINSMSFGGKRPSKADKRKARMAEIAEYTGRHHQDTLRKELRKIPIQFVMAEEVYNPAEDMVQNLILREGQELSQPNDEHEGQTHDMLLERATEMIKESMNVSNDFMDGVNRLSEEEEEEDQVVSDVPDTSPHTEVVSLKSESEIESDEEDNGDDMEFVDDNEDDDYHGSDNEKENDSDGFELYDYDSGLENEKSSSEREDIVIGKFSGPLKRGEDGDYYVDLPKAGRRSRRNFGFEELKTSSSSSVQLVKPRLSLDGEPDVMISDDEPSEFGFLPEDYVSFDVTQIRIDSIRKGAGDDAQYHVSAPILFGFEDFTWTSQEELKESMVSQGLPEKRFGAFIQYATKELREDSDDIESELSDEMLEGIDDMIAFQSNRLRVVNDPIDIGTHSLSVHGKGRHRQLEVPDDVDGKTREQLIKQFENKIEGKRLKRVRNYTDDETSEDTFLHSSDSYYLLKKYPYEMRIEDFRVELEDFVTDKSRNSMRFPPMDSHGCMTLRDLSKAYHIKARKFGNSPESYVVMIKTSVAKRLKPDYKEVDKLMQRRRIFFRSDTGLTKLEKQQLKRLLSDKDTSEQKRKKERKGAFTYKEGDVVGENASEIGPESIGRQLLVKMGWQKGEALGAEGNKGIIEPIMAVVKNTKAGIR
ncbi:hypothetical protein FOA43_000349 [Brettanomyces nanus]|uniref:Protein SQS1 n=1 Tax=Eeniella nana TaxID=13502 RepID=A0A875RYB9_EENNA|nr:uncharacterized protein FOA43_000349 [Brettanomyces nanus]QPG73045.1 hypothetical protein FOA43_000349 [Brettanomyces nanus]